MKREQDSTPRPHRGKSSTRWHGLVAVLWYALMLGFVVFIYLSASAQPQGPSFFTEEQAETGLIAYSQHCASCHSADLRGISAPTLVGETFLTRWEGRTVASLYSYTHNAMPPGRGGSLSDETYVSTVAYVLQQNGLPSGEEALQPDLTQLQNLVITPPDTPELPDSSALMSQYWGNIKEWGNITGWNDVAQQPQVMLVQADMSTPPANTGMNPNTAEQIYEARCAACHGSDGGGGIGPSLTNNPRLEDAQWTIRRIAIGGLGMPAYAHQLSSADIAEVTSYIRSSFNNTYGAVDADAVNEVVSGLEPSNLQPVTTNLAAAPLGEQRYTQLCAACHGLQGGGGAGPPLAGNTDLDNTQNVVTTILYGREQMPAFSLYSDRDIAEISSYIRNAWGNSYGAVSADVVQVYRPNTAQVPTTNLNPVNQNLSTNQSNVTNQDIMTNQNGEVNQSNSQNELPTSPEQNSTQSQDESQDQLESTQNENETEQEIQTEQGGTE